VPRFEPFAGVRYDEAQVELGDVIAPPYDVISPDEQLQLEARSRYNAVHIELPRGEGGVDRYDVAAGYWRQWRDARIVARDDRPAFYGYRMTFSNDAHVTRHTLGVIGALGLPLGAPALPGAHGDVLPHERTTPKPKGDRLYLLRATGVNTSPIWGLSPATGLTAAITDPPPQTTPVTDDDGVTHQLWPIIDPATTDGITRLIAGQPVIIADGHHRYETALAYQQEHATAPGADAVMALVVELVDTQLSVQAIHRIISGLPARLDLNAALAPYFELETTGPPDASITARMADSRALALHTRTGTWLLHPRPETEQAAEQDLDSSRLDVALTALPEHELVFQHGWDLATQAVDAGDADAAILLRPATVAQIAATGKEGVRMPPKTTFFWPKPRTGLVFRELR
jgi:uncharacterized protein (DUF1015 family)